MQLKGVWGGHDTSAFCGRSYVCPVSVSFFVLIPQSDIDLLHSKCLKSPLRCLDTSLRQLPFETPGYTLAFLETFIALLVKRVALQCRISDRIHQVLCFHALIRPIKECGPVWNIKPNRNSMVSISCEFPSSS